MYEETYLVTVKIPLMAVGDPDARLKCRKIIDELLGNYKNPEVSTNLQQIYKDRAPRKIPIKIGR